ncbi:hypothetical protein [Halovenus amylolytica]|uniref:hypothetical protein n=1 Tax=Halovenus amylolytica TaxID=2500550 RepID=UPI003D6AC8A3
MKILDTNLWVFGTLGTHAHAETLLDQIESGKTTSAINAYMIQEALEAFDRTPNLSTTERDEFKTVFLSRLVRIADAHQHRGTPTASDVSGSTERRNELA